MLFIVGVRLFVSSIGKAARKNEVAVTAVVAHRSALFRRFIVPFWGVRYRKQITLH